MQLVELQDARDRFKRVGMGLAAVTYDNEATLREFATAQRIEYPLLADPASKLIRAFNVLDPDNSDFNRAGDGSAKQDMAYPGTFVINADGVVTEKFFEEIYSDRHTPNSVFGRLFPELMESRGDRIRVPHLSLRPGQSDQVAAPGNRVTLFVDIELPPGVHVYAPGVERYRPLELRLDPPAPFETRPAVFPPSTVMKLPAIKERARVFHGTFRVSRDVIAPGRDRDFLISVRDSPDHSKTVEIPGMLLYQACDAKVCYRPTELPLSWQLTVKLRKLSAPASP